MSSEFVGGVVGFRNGSELMMSTMMVKTKKKL